MVIARIKCAFTAKSRKADLCNMQNRSRTCGMNGCYPRHYPKNPSYQINGSEVRFNPQCRQNHKTAAGSFKLHLRALAFGIIPGMLSYPDIPQKQRSLFFDVLWSCGQRHLGIEEGFWALLACKSAEPTRR